MRTPTTLLVTDPAYADDHIAGVIERVSVAVPRGTFAVQVRDKWSDRDTRLSFARRLRELTTKLGVALVVNGDESLALEVGADGLHAPASQRTKTVENLWWSAPAHSDHAILAACEAGVDAVLVSPIFDTPGKGASRGVAALTRARSLAAGRCAVLGLGGIDASSARACFEAGADGVAVIRALLAATDPAAVARAFLEAASPAGVAKTEGDAARMY